jgi:cell division protein FtsB
LRVHELQQQLAQQIQKNADAKLRNERIQGEVQDLQNGTAAVEERARYEMGMVKDGEVFVQFVSPNAPLPTANAPSTGASTRGEVSAAPLHVVPNPESRAKPERKHGSKAAKEKKPAH